MEVPSFLKRIVPQPVSKAFEVKKNNLTVRVLVISSVVIYIIETLLMIILEYVLGIPDPAALVIDGLILITLLFPINYFLIVRPMLAQIDEHYQTSQELLKANEILERFFSISDILIAYLDTDFNFLRVNRAFAAVDERPEEAFIGKNHFDLFPHEENKTIFQAVVQTGKPYFALERPFEYAEHPERGITYWDWSLLPVKSPDNRVAALILVLNNVTARKEAQLALLDSERRFRSAFNQTFQHSVLLDPSGTALLVNQTALDFSGCSQEEIKGLPLWQLPWWDLSLGGPEIVEQLEAAVRQAARGEVVRFEHRIRSKNSQKAVMDTTIKPIYDASGSIILLNYEARDITDRYRAEKALRSSEEEIKRLYISERNAHEFAEALRNAMLAFSGSLDSGTVLKSLLDHLNRVVPFNSAHIFLLEDEENLAVYLARGEEHWPEQDRLLGKIFDIADIPFLEPLFQQRETLSITDTLIYTGMAFFSNDEFVRCWLGIPLLAGEQVVGICTLEHNCPGFFTDERTHWAAALTGQAAVAIQNAWLYEQVRDGRERLQALSHRLVEVQENERHYIARELHDETGQALTSLLIGLRRLENDSADQSAVIARSRELKQLTDNILENLHRLAVHLRPATLDQLGLAAALRQHADTIRAQHDLTVQFETVGSIDRLPGELETAVYRIVQETLTNVIRHAGASRVDILLERRDDQLVVVVEDNGIGFNPQISRTNHLGIIGMHERAEMLGGRIMIESSPGRGSSVILEVPCIFES